ncbi:MAG TPA: error-prone DNA polymerase [Gemmatimonadaceae bacterium]|nr:error-prone DNA polymerase [Gemmatimonadaceae bacterium]
MTERSIPITTAPNGSYAELHCHSAFSLLDGASEPEELVARAVALGMPALALTDHADLGGAVRFAQAARDAGIAGIVGNELTLAVDRRRTHLVLLAMTREGYGNLATLITRARLDTPRGQPVVSLDLLARHARGLFALSGCARGWIPSLLAEGRYDAACDAAATLRDIFEGNLAIECWDHHLGEERALVPHLIRLARALDLPWLVTNDVHYATPRKRLVHDALCALRHGRTLDTMGTRLRPNGEWYLKGGAQMLRRWQDRPEGVGATLGIAERCTFRLHDLRPALPAFPLPPGVSADEYLARLVEQGALERIGRAGARALTDLPESYRKQIDHELDIIRRLGLAGYFLVVWDIVRFARRAGILCQGRGSAANSVVCYALGITAIDPVRMGLLFERFLSEERQEAPDIDIDFAHRDREKVLQYVYERYGREHAAMVCEHITYRGRSAVRDAARVLGFSTAQAEALSTVAERSSAAATARAFRDCGAHGKLDPLVAAGLDPADRRVQLLSDLVEGLHRLPRHRSIHVGGFVLTREPLCTVVPIEPASMPGRTIIQWERDDLDPAGLIKIDLLGLGMLTVLQDCLKYIRATRGVSLDLGQLDMNDQAVYDDLCAADTIGVFQVESRAQMNTLPRLQPRCFYDLVVEVAIIRPGPIQGEMVNPYLRRRMGLEEITYPHPALEPVLRRTLGVPLFQEQGMQVAIAAAGFTPTEADALRRAMGHKRSRERMASICQKLVDGMQRNGIPSDVAQRIYNQINAFADYGFPESHAASFALIVYASAYLRHYYRPEFTAAILNAQPMGFYSPGTLIEDARRHGVEVRPIDLTRSAWDHSLELPDRSIVPHDGDISIMAVPAEDPQNDTVGNRAPAVRLGLRLVRGLGAAAREQLEKALQDGPFRDIDDFVRRTRLDERALRSLCEAGAFDSMVSDLPRPQRRRAALWRVLDAVRGDAGPLAPRHRECSARVERALLPAMSALELTAADYRLTSLSLNGHPLSHLRHRLQKLGVRTARDILSRGRDGERVTHAGLVICRQRPGTAKGFVFMSLEDETGILNAVVTPRLFERQALLISGAALLLVRGTLQVQQGVVNLRGEQFHALAAGAGEHWAPSRDFH